MAICQLDEDAQAPHDLLSAPGPGLRGDNRCFAPCFLQRVRQALEDTGQMVTICTEGRAA